MHLFKRYKNVIISVLLLTIPFFFLNANLKDPNKLNPLDKILLEIASPLQWTARISAEWFNDIWSNYIYLFDVKQENDKLVTDVLRLREENRRLMEAMTENRRLKKLLAFKENFPARLLSARVVIRDINEFFRVVRVKIDRGERDVRIGMAVITPQGLIGQINRIWSDYAEVLLIVDPKSAVDVEIERTGSRGILKGIGRNNSYICEIEFMKRFEEIKSGDLLFTSGVGKRFPSGILVGKVSKINKRDFGLYQEVEVEPAVDISRLKEVFVILSTERMDVNTKTKDSKKSKESKLPQNIITAD